MGLLGEFLRVLNSCFAQPEDSDVIMEILKELSACSRFNLSLGFLGKSEKEAVSEFYLCLIVLECGF